MTMRNMLSTLFTLALAGATIYFFYDYNFFLAVVFLIWTLSRLFGYSFQRLVKGFGEITTHSQLEKKCNVVLEIKINIEEVLKHKAVSELFERLKKQKNIEKKSKDEWIKDLLHSYKKKFDKKETLEEVKFNIKNNVLWKNGEIDFNDSVYHEVFIPYNLDEFEKKELSPYIYTGLTIRVFIVNGIIKLQIGDFAKEVSPEVIKKGLDVYKTHETIASFPLMYFHWQHKIPENYLNLSMYATDSYYKHLKGDKEDFTKDWKEINKEIRDYNYVCSIADEYVEDRGRWEKIVKEFDEKKDKMLKENDFKDPFARDENDDYYYDDWRDNNVYFINKLMTIFVANYNENKEKREKFVYTDYYEERP